jgi:glycosyltransferase involved in cell wall biosynthesis
MKRILFLTQGDEHVASSRHRVYQYLPMLKNAGFETIVHPAVTAEEFQQIFINRSLTANIHRLSKTFVRRVRDLHEIRDYDFVYIQKPILPAPFFNIESKISREAKMIFDFDDAIFLKKAGGTVLPNIWSQTNRVASICRVSRRVVVGNSYLGDFVKRSGVEPIVIPTAIDLNEYPDSLKSSKRAHKIPVIGWIGSPSTQSDLKLVVEGLVKLHSKAPFVVKIIGGNPESIPVRFPVEWKPWKLITAVPDVMNLDYGLAPLHDTDWNRGKCGLKVLQYWAAGVPVIASPVGVYKEMIQDRQNGLLASNPAEWTANILELMTNPNLYQKIVSEGRRTVLEKYSIQALSSRFLDLFRSDGSEKK